MNFTEKLDRAIVTNQSLLIMGLEPNLEMLPNLTNNGDIEHLETLIPQITTWLEQLITKTSNHVCAYKPTLGYYQALGAAGIQLLSHILTKIPDHIPIILDAKHGDLNTSSIFAQTIFEKWQVDAITLSAYPGQDHIAPFLLFPDKAVFILCHTSNPGAVTLQQYPTPESPFYLHLITEAQTWGTPEQLALEIGSSNPEIFAKVRQIAPERLILARSIWSKSQNINQILTAGLNHNGDGLLIPIPEDWLGKSDLIPRIETLKAEINQIRENITTESSNCQLWTANVCFLQQHPHQTLILQLYDIGCLLFGDYVQASGATFSYYIDLRKIISNPQIFSQVIQAYAEILEKLTFDRLAGIPYGSLPTATGLSLVLNRPMIYPRKEVKAHGTRRVIEGNFHPGEKVVMVDDILISGKSALEGAEKLKSADLIVEDIVVFIDHEGGVKDKLKAHGYNAYSVLRISEITETLYQAGRISEQQYQLLIHN